MASEKATLRNNITYLKSRRSGVEFSIGKSTDELKQYISRCNYDIADQEARLYRIELNEADRRAAEKAYKAQQKKEVWKK